MPSPTSGAAAAPADTMDLWVHVPPSPPPTPAPPEAALTTQERLRLAKRRRATQLKRWAQREREKNTSQNFHGQQPDLIPSQQVRGVQFVSSVMLLEASARNDVEEVRRLLRIGVSPDSTNEDGLTALHQCCIDDSEEMMQVLLEYGANPNATDTEKWTPLHAAATCGHLHLVKFLIEHGADLLAVNADGNMPYDLCDDDTTLSYIENEMAKRGVTQELIDTTRAETEMKMLQDLKCCESTDLFEARDPASGATPLHVAAANGYLSVVEFLLDNHVSTEVIDYDQWQPIHAAACWGHLEVVELLAQNGANISAKTKNGETPFDICEDPEIKERLIQLKEQRVRLEQPRVRRTRSASTRTQSIRRTSLREKMNTTKKDVQDEKLYFIQSFDAIPKSDEHAKPTKPSRDDIESADIVDVNDVELVMPGTGRESPLPKRPPRANAKDNNASPPIGPTSVLPVQQQSPLPSTSSSDKINIHVSVTINAPSTPQQQQHQSHPSPASGSQPQLQYHHHATSSIVSSPTNSGAQTLADLKKARSMSRANAGAPPNVTSPTSIAIPPPFSEPHTPAPRPSSPAATPREPANRAESPKRHGSRQKSRRAPPPDEPTTMGPVIDQGMELRGLDKRGESSRRKYTATTTELIGPDKKKGCCTIV